MTSLVFRALDQQVVAGLADEDAVADERGTLSYAELLHESACVAGAMSHLGVSVGTPVAIEATGRERIIAVLACARLGALPGTSGAHRLVGDPPVLHAPDTEVPWDLLMRAGRSEPAPAPSSDPEDYEELMMSSHGDVFAPLLAGRAIT